MAELKPGYKLTEVGVIPEDWNEVTLGLVTDKIGSGITPRGGSKIYQSHGRPFVRSQNVGWGILSLEDLAFISDEIHATFDATEIRPNDVFLNITGASIGRSAIADERVVNGNVNQHVCIIRTIPERLHPRYLNYFLLSNMGQKQIDSFQAGGNRQGLNFGQIRSFQLALPPTLEEQQAIATALNEVSEQIAALDDLITKKRDLKQAAMQRLLTGEERLPGFSSAWEVKRLKDIGEALIGLTYSPDKVVADGILVLRSSNIQNERLTYTDNVYVDMPIPNQIITRKDDILICVRNGSRELIGKCALIDEQAAGITFGAFMSVFRTPYARFVFYQFQSDLIKEQIEKNIGATINQITNKNLYEFEIPLPKDEDEQNAIATVLSDMDTEINGLEEKREKTISLKQGMMQELLTGKTRLV